MGDMENTTAAAAPKKERKPRDPNAPRKPRTKTAATMRVLMVNGDGSYTSVQHDTLKNTAAAKAWLMSGNAAPGSRYAIVRMIGEVSVTAETKQIIRLG